MARAKSKPARGSRSRRGRVGAWRRGLAWVVVAAAAIGLGWWASGWRWSEIVETARSTSHIQRVESHAEAIRFAAAESRIDPCLLAGLMLSESGGRVDAVSRVDALGLFQLALPTALERARALGLPEPSRQDLLGDARLNARLAASYVKWLERRYDGALEPMMVAYNAGPGRLASWVQGAGGYAAWRAERAAAGDSGVLRFAAKVAHFREVFARRGVIAPAVNQPPVPSALLAAQSGALPAQVCGPPEAPREPSAHPSLPPVVVAKTP